MTSTQKNLAPAATGDQANEKLPTAISTTNDTPKHRTWHIHVGNTEDGLAKGLCGWESKPGFRTSDAPHVPVDHCIPVECPDCAALASMQNPAVQRRKRAEAITEFVLRYLDDQEAKDA